jgi:uncharacterized protein YcnI
MKRHLALGALVAGAALAYGASASAHAELSPAVALAKHGQLFTLAVPTEKDGVTTTSVELTLPARFSIDSFLPAPGWNRAVRKTTVTWSGGAVPTGEDAAFSFLANAGGAATYTFAVRQTYSDGTVVDWSGPESSDTPAPVVEAVSSLRGGGSSTLSVVALAVAAVALLVALAGLLTRTGRPLT